MSSYDFDKIIDRKNTGSLKWDFAVERGVPEDALPMWVADMDFMTAPPVVEALKKTAESGIYGYTNTKKDFASLVCDWYERYFGYRFKEEHFVKTPGVVFALATAVRACTGPGDGVLIQQPVYYPFANVIRTNGRKVINSPLIYSGGSYTMDFEDMEDKIVKNNLKLFILCSPHNPVGRVWTRSELDKVFDICARHEVVVVSDEIHCDFTYEGHEHTIFASLDERAADISVVCTSPSKTFNLAGLQYSGIFIKNEALRRKFIAEIWTTGYDEPSCMGIAAARAAYSEGHEWLLELKKYIASNLDFMREYLKDKLPGAYLVEPEGTYLAWVDLSALGLSDAELNDRILHQAKLWLDAGNIFGKSGEGFERFNIACPRAILEEALERLTRILD